MEEAACGGVAETPAICSVSSTAGASPPAVGRDLSCSWCLPAWHPPDLDLLLRGKIVGDEARERGSGCERRGEPVDVELAW